MLMLVCDTWVPILEFVTPGSPAQSSRFNWGPAQILASLKDILLKVNIDLCLKKSR